MLPTVIDQGLIDACGDTPSWFCEAAWNLTESRSFARAADWVVAKPLVALIIVVVAALVNRLLRRGIDGLVMRVTDGDTVPAAALGRLGIGPAQPDPRARARAATLSTVLRAVGSTLVWTVAVLMVLGVFEIDLGPLLAGAGIAGIAIGLGAQSLVRDCIAGFFILLEDQFGVGDTVDLGPAVGAVETLTLRSTTVRSLDGTVWSVPNGSILRVGNRSRAWVRIGIDVTVAPGVEMAHAQAALTESVERIASSEEHRDSVVAPPTVVPVARVTTEGVVLRVTVRVRPGAQSALLSEIRATVVADLAAADIPITAMADA